jgi:hypothetical protein
MVQAVLLPLLGFLIALFGVYFDAGKNPKSLKTVALIAILVITAVLTGWTAWDANIKAADDAKKAADNNGALRVGLETANSALKLQSGALDAVQSSTANISDMLVQQFGIRPKDKTAAVLQTALHANEAIARLSTSARIKTNERVTVQIFPHQLDRETVQETLAHALSSEGFLLKSGVPNPVLVDLPTNIVWYGADVPDESVRLVALALVRAGVPIKQMAPFESAKTAAKSRLIEIGSLSGLDSAPPLTVDEIGTGRLQR